MKEVEIAWNQYNKWVKAIVGAFLGGLVLVGVLQGLVLENPLGSRGNSTTVELLIILGYFYVLGFGVMAIPCILFAIKQATGGAGKASKGKQGVLLQEESISFYVPFLVGKISLSFDQIYQFQVKARKTHYELIICKKQEGFKALFFGQDYANISVLITENGYNVLKEELTEMKHSPVLIQKAS